MRGYRIFAIDVIMSMDLMRYYKLFSFTPLLPTSYSSCEHQSASTLQSSPRCPRPRKKGTPKKENHISTPTRSSETRVLTSSPTLIALPPQPGSSTRSPAFTAVGTTLPSLSGAPGPTAITVASGRGFDVAEVGRKIPDAVFYNIRIFLNK